MPTEGAIWFTPNRAAAEHRAGFDEAKIVSARLKMDRPLDLRADDDVSGTRKLIESLFAVGTPEAKRAASAIERAIEYGMANDDHDVQNAAYHVRRAIPFLEGIYDGLILDDYGMEGHDDAFTSYVVFDPSQVRPISS
jgi:hypothetical protein